MKSKARVGDRRERGEKKTEAEKLIGKTTSGLEQKKADRRSTLEKKGEAFNL